ncbi:MAG: C39 family peptidase [Acidobacteriota bacterium]
MRIEAVKTICLSIAMTIILSVTIGVAVARAFDRGSQPEHFLQLPLVRQSTDYSCGVAALQSVLYYYGEEIREDRLAKALGTTSQDGTDYRKIISFSNKVFQNPDRRNLQMSKQTDMTIEDLKLLVDAKKPTIVLIQAWANPGVDWANDWEDGHYVVVVGYDDSNIYFVDPSTLGHYTYIPIPEFRDRWHDLDPSTGEKLVHFGLVIGNDDKVPTYRPKHIKRMN